MKVLVRAPKGAGQGVDHLSSALTFASSYFSWEAGRWRRIGAACCSGERVKTVVR